MKIRWNRSSIRLRITPSELTRLEDRQDIKESLALPGTDGGWRVVVRIGGESTTLRQEAATMVFQLAEADLVRLLEPEREGVYFSQGTLPETLAYYIEKDFPCAHPRAEEVQALSASGTYVEETFPAPAGFVERKHSDD